jgi:hypothetical protein
VGLKAKSEILAKIAPMHRGAPAKTGREILHAEAPRCISLVEWEIRTKAWAELFEWVWGAILETFVEPDMRRN